MMSSGKRNVNSTRINILKICSIQTLLLVTVLYCSFSNKGVNASDDYDCLIYPDVCDANEICIERTCVPLYELENSKDQLNHNNKRLEEELFTDPNDSKEPIRIHKYDVDFNDFDEENRDDDLDTYILPFEIDDGQELLDASELGDIENDQTIDQSLNDINEAYNDYADMNEAYNDYAERNDYITENEPITVTERDLEDTFEGYPISRPYLNLKREATESVDDEIIKEIEDLENDPNDYIPEFINQEPFEEPEEIIVDFPSEEEEDIFLIEPGSDSEISQENVGDNQNNVYNMNEDISTVDSELNSLDDLDSILELESDNLQNGENQFVIPSDYYIPNQQQLQQQTLPQQLMQQMLDTGYVQNGPFLFENSGLDQNGLPFLERQVVQSNFYATPDQFLNYDLPAGNLVPNMDSQINQQVMGNQISQQMMGNQISQQMMGNQINQQMMDTPLVQALKNIALSNQQQNFKNAQDTLVKFEDHQIPGLQKFHLIENEIQQNENEQVENTESIDNESLEKDLLDSTDSEMMPQQNVKKDQLVEDNEEVIDLEKEVQNKEQTYLKKFLGDRVQLLKNGKLIDDSYLYIQLDKKTNRGEAEALLKYLSELTTVPYQWIQDISVSENLIVFKVKNIDLDGLCELIQKNHQLILKEKNFNIVTCHRGNVQIKQAISNYDRSKSLFIITIVSCLALLLSLVVLLSVFVVRRKAQLRQRIVDGISTFKKKPFDDVEQLVGGEDTRSRSGRFMSRVWPFKTRQDLCQSTNSTISPLTNTTTTDLTNRCDTFDSPMNKSNVSSTPIHTKSEDRNESNRSSASSWSEEPVVSINMDISTGHAILSYMETHLNDKNLLSNDWDELCNYEADQSDVFIGKSEVNMSKNRYSNILPYDHNRVKLEGRSDDESDYINASYITDDDPKNPAYIATQGPLAHTTSDFWQMVWEQNSVIIVSLCRTVEYGSSKCNQYWPVNGFETFDNYEVHLVSEHVWCEDYLVRSFYLKNKTTNQTRTVTQFQFLTWPEKNIPPNIKSILDFRRKVNKSYNRKSFPIIVHCNDGIGRTGTYIMIDMILNKIMKEAKEIDLAATLEYLRDQRKEMIKNRNQFEFSFAVITDEVQNMLKTLTQ